MTNPLSSVGINSVVVSGLATGAAIGMATRNVWWGIAALCALTTLLLGALKIASVMSVIRRHYEQEMMERIEQKLDALDR